MDQILMQQHNSFENKLTNIQNTNSLLDQLQRKMNSYFTNNNTNNNVYKQNDNQNQDNDNENGNTKSNKNIHSQINYRPKYQQDEQQNIPVFRRNSVNGYVRGKDNYGIDKQQQLQFKIYNNQNNNNSNNRNRDRDNNSINNNSNINNNNKNKGYTYTDNNRNNITTQTIIGTKTQYNYRPSISQKQVKLKNQRLSKTTSTPIVPNNNNNDNTNNNNNYENNGSMNNRKKSQQFKLFSKPKSKQKQKQKYTQNNVSKSNKKVTYSNSKGKIDNLLSQQQQDDRIVIEIDTKYNRTDNNINNKSYNKNKYVNNYNNINNNNKQEWNTNYGEKYTLNKYQNQNIQHNYESFGKRNQQNVSYIGNMGNSYEKSRNKLVNQMETIQILMKQRIAAKQRKIKQIQQQIVTQNQQRVYLYKINVKLNEQLRFLQHQQATKEAENTKNQEWKIMKLQQQVQKLKKQINKKKDQRKQLRKQQKTLKQGYQTVINNKKNILRSDIQKYMQQQNKTKQNTDMLKGLMKQLDKLKGVVQSKIKQSHVTVASKSRKVIKSFKN